MPKTVVPPYIDTLLTSAVDDGNLSARGRSLIITVPDMTRAIQAGLCAAPQNVHSAEPFLLLTLADNTGSIIGITGGAAAICSGQRLILDALMASKGAAGFLASTWLMNPLGSLQPFTLVETAVRLEDGVNYRAFGETPLYRGTCMGLATIAAEIQRFRDQFNTTPRASMIIVSDGLDEDYGWRAGRGNKVFTPDDCRDLIETQAENLIVMFIGIGGKAVDFRQIAREMGILDKFILTPGATPHEIRDAFGTASRTTKQASQSRKSFSATAAGGFASA